LDIVRVDSLETDEHLRILRRLISFPAGKWETGKWKNLYKNLYISARADFLLWWFVWGNTYPYEI
jgi:hypothetical protein